MKSLICSVIFLLFVRNSHQIFGGNSATIASYRHHAAIWVRTPTLAYSCGATLIWNNYVVTTAKCVDQVITNYKVTYGTDNLTAVTTANELTIIRKKVHELYNPTTLDYNIALLKTSAVNYNLGTPIVFIWNLYKYVDGAMLTITGFGASANAGSNSATLKVAEVPVFNWSKCYKRFPNLAEFPRMCVGVPTGTVNIKDVCQGDEGSPAVVKNGFNSWVLIGIVNKINTCGVANSPNLFVDVGAMSVWLGINIWL